MNERTVSVVIPCVKYDPTLFELLDSLWRSTLTPTEVILVQDGQSFPIVSGQITRVIGQEHRGKAAAIANGVSKAKGDLVFCVDMDTTIAPDCLDRLANHIFGDIVVTAPQVKVKNITSWIGLIRQRIYDQMDSLDLNDFIPGCAFMVSKDFLVNNPIPNDTLEEDRDFTVIVAHSDKSFVKVKSAKVFTTEPEKVGALFRQEARWEYGRLQVIRKYAPQQVALGYVVVGSYSSMLVYSVIVNKDALLLLAGLGAGVVLVTVGNILLSAYGNKIRLSLDLAKFVIAEEAAKAWAAILYTLRLKPKW